ncbi:YceI family protein [Zhouia sp. PK063]|uniref:YceI family protein n=1 Tax=Zhouia sp. PK063 TaxID=3373602 RepID=UPI00378ECD56
MKRVNVLSMLLIVLFINFTTPVKAQEHAPETNISYKVDFGPVYPIEGESNQFKGNIALDDETHQLNNLSFNVPLNSFIGTNSGYLAWVGNAWNNPDLTFKSTVIKKVNNHFEVKGNMEFRRKTAPVTLEIISQENSNNEIILKGNFKMNTNDYFIFSPNVNLVPTWIPFQFTMVFDKPNLNEVS